MDLYKNNPLAIPVAGIFVVGCLSTIFSISPIDSLLGGYKRYNGLFSLAIYIFLFFAIINYMKIEMLDMFLNVIIFAACISCIWGLCQYYDLIGGVKWSTNYGYGGRLFSTIGHPGFFSAYLIMVLPLVYYQIYKGRWYFIAVLALILFAFYLTKTRAAWGGLVVSTIFFFAFTLRENRVKAIAIASVIIIITIFCSSTLIKRFSHELSGKLSVSAYIKLQTARVSLLTIKDYPILGIGFDNFGIVYPYYLNQYVNKTDRNQKVHQEIQDRVHNDFFDVTVQTGLIGLAIYLWFIYSYSKMIWQNIARNRLLVMALCSSIIAYWCSIQACFGHVPSLTIYWTILALSVIACKEENEQKKEMYLL